MARFTVGIWGWKNTHRRYCRWRDKGIWESLLEEVITEPDYEWLMIDASHIKVHPHGTGAVGGNQAMNRTKGGSIPRYTWPWIRMVCRSDSLLQKAQRQTVITRHHWLYAKKITSLIAAVQIRCIAISANISWRYYLVIRTINNVLGHVAPAPSCNPF